MAKEEIKKPLDTVGENNKDVNIQEIMDTMSKNFQEQLKEALAEQAKGFEDKISTMERAYAQKLSPDAGRQVDKFTPTARVHLVNGRVITDIKMTKDFIEVRESGVQVHIQECELTTYKPKGKDDDKDFEEFSKITIPLREYLGVRDSKEVEIIEEQKTNGVKTGIVVVVEDFGNVTINPNAIN